jgi:hypothetical protein
VKGLIGEFILSADCFDDGRNYPGNEVASLPDISSPYFCLMECKKSPDCLFYSYNINKKVCSLKSSNGNPRPSPSTVSGSVVCEPRGN